MSVRRHLWLQASVALRAMAAAVLVGAFGCEAAPAQIEIPDLTPPYDAAVAVDVPDGAVACTSDGQCYDGIDCTRDVCVEGAYCVNASDPSRCTDGVFCNGPEVCDPSMGCRPSEPLRCRDDSVCTVDSCDEQGKRCVHAPRDFDGDGEVDWHCAGGTDCDDFDEARGAQAAEVCGDGIDNDCDGERDERGCGTPVHDRCDDALDVSAGGVFSASLLGARPDYALGCGEAAGRELAFVFDLEEAQDVALQARGRRVDGSEEVATLALREDCADAGTELECARGFPGTVRVRALPAGRYFVLAHSRHAAQLVLEIAFAPVSDVPSNLTCDAPRDLGLGGRVSGSFVDAGDDVAIGCGLPSAADLTYTLTLAEESDVELLATSVTGERMHLSVRARCEDASSELRCISNAPAVGRLHRVPAGRYDLVVESTSTREVDFTLEVAIEPPSDAPEGDACEDPFALRTDTATVGTLAGLQDDVDVRCGCDDASCSRHLPDAVYRLDLTSDSDLWLALDGEGVRMHYALLRGCGGGAELVACGDGTPAAARISGLDPGRYFLAVEAQQSTGFRLQVDALEPRVPMSVSGNDTCEVPFDVPPEGGTFVGDTFDLAPDYFAGCGAGALSNDAVFRMVLEQRSRVRASLHASFDAVLHRFSQLGQIADLGCESGLEDGCDDDSGPGWDPLLDDTLDAGVYYYVVDGFGEDNAGEYTFDLTIGR